VIVIGFELGVVIDLEPVSVALVVVAIDLDFVLGFALGLGFRLLVEVAKALAIAVVFVFELAFAKGLGFVVEESGPLEVQLLCTAEVVRLEVHVLVQRTQGWTGRVVGS
jgi:hypothetical protein